MNFDFNKFGDTVVNVLDKVNQGIGTYYNSRIAINEHEARLAASETAKENTRAINDINRGSAASDWGNPNDIGEIFGGNTQTILIIGAVALVAVAVLKG